MSRRRLVRSCLAVWGALALSATGTMHIPTATARTAQVAPGAPIRQEADFSQNGLPKELNDTVCSQGPNGKLRLLDGSEKNVMITAGHCTMTLDESEPYKPGVYLPTRGGNKLLGFNDRTSGNPFYFGADLGKLVRVNFDSGDWSVVALQGGFAQSRVSESRNRFGRIKGHPVTMTGIKDYKRLRPHEVSFDNFGKPICKDGAMSGRSCGQQIFRTNNSVWSYRVGYQHGDSGGNNYDPATRQVIGVTSMSIGPFDRAQPADIALEQGYGIPDGKVNEHFTLAPSTARHDPSLRTAQQDIARSQAIVKDVPVEDLASPEQLRALETIESVGNTVKETKEGIDRGVATAQATGNVAPLANTLGGAARDLSRQGPAIADAALTVALELL